MLEVNLKASSLSPSCSDESTEDLTTSPKSIVMYPHQPSTNSSALKAATVISSPSLPSTETLHRNDHTILDNHGFMLALQSSINNYEQQFDDDNDDQVITVQSDQYTSSNQRQALHKALISATSLSPLRSNAIKSLGDSLANCCLESSMANLFVIPENSTVGNLDQDCFSTPSSSLANSTSSKDSNSRKLSRPIIPSHQQLSFETERRQINFNKHEASLPSFSSSCTLEMASKTTKQLQNEDYRVPVKRKSSTLSVQQNTTSTGTVATSSTIHVVSPVRRRHRKNPALNVDDFDSIIAAI